MAKSARPAGGMHQSRWQDGWAVTGLAPGVIDQVGMPLPA
jgi:hypothetical protein